MTCEGRVEDWSNNKATRSNWCLFINLVQKCSLNRYILITAYFSWHKLKHGLFSNLVIQPEGLGMQIMRSTSVDMSQTVHCLQKRQAHNKVCAAFATSSLTTSPFCSLLVGFCSLLKVPIPELRNAGQTQNIPFTEFLTFFTLQAETWTETMKRMKLFGNLCFPKTQVLHFTTLKLLNHIKRT